jgi:hypothetical protein
LPIDVMEPKMRGHEEPAESLADLSFGRRYAADKAQTASQRTTSETKSGSSSETACATSFGALADCALVVFEEEANENVCVESNHLRPPDRRASDQVFVASTLTTLTWDPHRPTQGQEVHRFRRFASFRLRAREKQGTAETSAIMCPGCAKRLRSPCTRSGVERPNHWLSNCLLLKWIARTRTLGRRLRREKRKPRIQRFSSTDSGHYGAEHQIRTGDLRLGKALQRMCTRVHPTPN